MASESNFSVYTESDLRRKFQIKKIEAQKKEKRKEIRRHVHFLFPWDVPWTESPQEVWKLFSIFSVNISKELLDVLNCRRCKYLATCVEN